MVDIPVGNSVRVCGCVGLIDDTNLEGSETFNIAATINDPIMTSSAPLSTVVLVQDDPTDSKKTRTLSFAPLTFSVCVCFFLTRYQGLAPTGKCPYLRGFQIGDSLCPDPGR